MAELHPSCAGAPARAPSSSPFVFDPSPQPFRKAEHTGANTTYVLYASGPRVASEECELPDVASLEVMILWGTTVMHVAHLTPPRAFRLGSEESERPDFLIGRAQLGASDWQLVELCDGVPHVLVPPGARATLRSSGRAQAPSAAVQRSDGVERIALGPDHSVDVALGALTFRVSAVCAGKPSPRAFAATDRSSLTALALSTLLQLGVISALALFTPSLGLNDEEGLDMERIYAIQQYLDAAAERERERERAEAEQGGEAHVPSGKSEAAHNAAGEMGKVNAPRANRRTGTKGPRDNPDPHLARQQALQEARTFGLIGMLNSMDGSTGLTVPWGRDTALGIDDSTALGNMFGLDIGEAGGSGGLSVSGLEQGGGGVGAGIGLDRVGTCGAGPCLGLPGGFGASLGRQGPGHKTTAPRLRPQGITSVGGRLPPEVIQRVVRQNFGRFRQCYEDGLRRNPTLEGRVAVRFVIGRDGAVSNAGNGGSDLADSGVVSCVIGAYYGLSFPAPEDGVVKVVYPILFTPGT
jgi:hypothetical protein